MVSSGRASSKERDVRERLNPPGPGEAGVEFDDIDSAAMLSARSRAFCAQPVSHFRSLPFQTQVPHLEDLVNALGCRLPPLMMQSRIVSARGPQSRTLRRTGQLVSVMPHTFNHEKDPGSVKTHSASIVGGAHGGRASVFVLRAALSSRHRRGSARHWCSASMGRAGAANAGERCSAATMAELTFSKVGERWRGCDSRTRRDGLDAWPRLGR